MMESSRLQVLGRSLVLSALLGCASLPASAQQTTLEGRSGVVAQAEPQAAGAGAEQGMARLERLRNALIDQALDAPVRVTSNAWLDESGQLRHVSRFFSEVRSRAAADALFQAAGASQPAQAEVGATVGSETVRATQGVSTIGGQQAEVEARSEVGSPPANRSANPARDGSVAPGTALGASTVPQLADAAAVCRVGGGELARAAVLHSTVDPSDGGRGHSILQEVERLTVSLFRERAGIGGLRIAGVDPLGADGYARLVSATGQLDAPYRIDIQIRSDRLQQPSLGRGAEPGQNPLIQVLWSGTRAFNELMSRPELRMPDRRVDLTFVLSEQFGGSVLLRHDLSLSIPGSGPSHNSPVLPDRTIEGARMAVLSWWSEAADKLRCHPVTVAATPSVAGAGSLTIPMGSFVGVRVGDRWAIGDAAKIPSLIIEPNALDRALLAEVMSVGPHRSVLRLTAAQGAARTLFSVEKGASWFATPL
jgi:hypothetical protein